MLLIFRKISLLLRATERLADFADRITPQAPDTNVLAEGSRKSKARLSPLSYLRQLQPIRLHLPESWRAAEFQLNQRRKTWLVYTVPMPSYCKFETVLHPADRHQIPVRIVGNSLRTGFDRIRSGPRPTRRSLSAMSFAWKATWSSPSISTGPLVEGAGAPDHHGYRAYTHTCPAQPACPASHWKSVCRNSDLLHGSWRVRRS